MDLEQLRIFDRVAELASFSQAADQLGLAKSRVSAVVAQLEVQIGARLLQRTTRRVNLTHDGEQFLDRCKDLLADADELSGLFQPAGSAVKGRVRFDLPNTLARDVVIPKLPGLLAKHPQLEVGISTSDRRVDLIRDGLDAVVRIGVLADADLVARPLGQLAMRNLASPAYLAEYGAPRTLDQLAQHRLIHYSPTLGMRGAGWEYTAGDAVRVHPMKSALVVNGTDAYQAACIAGLGIIQAPFAGSRRLIEAGTLVEVLPEFVAAPMQVSLLYPNRRLIPPRVRTTLEWLATVVTSYLQEAQSTGWPASQSAN